MLLQAGRVEEGGRGRKEKEGGGQVMPAGETTAKNMIAHTFSSKWTPPKPAADAVPAAEAAPTVAATGAPAGTDMTR